ncbi:4Fe-4S dicluster domain-containing protein [bacterium]|nr:4Fe-4S dicluster domain-containing protein [bacterium]
MRGAARRQALLPAAPSRTCLVPTSGGAFPALSCAYLPLDKHPACQLDGSPSKRISALRCAKMVAPRHATEVAMCEFCVQHGDGEKWYLRAQNYIADLESDLTRRGYLIDFVQDFPATRKKALRGVAVLDRAPRPLAAAAKREFNKHQREHHFGQPVPIEECERIFEMATSIVQLPCVCRSAAGTPEQGYCLAVTTGPIDSALSEAFAGYEGGPDTAGFQRLSVAEATALLRRCEDEGLMHSVWTFHSPLIGAICNCDLSSGCMAMNLTVAHDVKIMWRGEYVVGLDAASCTGCGACVRRCPFGAIDAPASRSMPVHVRQEACYGCGVCRSACRSGALSLADRASVPAMSQLW